jgi:hypothetical protein
MIRFIIEVAKAPYHGDTPAFMAAQSDIVASVQKSIAALCEAKPFLKKQVELDFEPVWVGASAFEINCSLKAAAEISNLPLVVFVKAKNDRPYMPFQKRKLKP